MRSMPRLVITLSAWRAALVLIGLTFALAVPASASAAAFSIRLHAPNHSPTAGRRWPITLDVRRGRAKLSGRVRYQFLFDGQLVAQRPGYPFKHGVYRDRLLFPSSAVGHPLILRIVVSTRYGTIDVDWAVKARA